MSAQSRLPTPASRDAADPIAELRRLQDDVIHLLTQLKRAESLWSPWLTAVAAEHQASARNLVHYWAIRQNDLRDLQVRLHPRHTA